MPRAVHSNLRQLARLGPVSSSLTKGVGAGGQGHKPVVHAHVASPLPGLGEQGLSLHASSNQVKLARKLVLSLSEPV